AEIALEVLQTDHPSLKQVSATQVATSQAKLADQAAQSTQGEPKWWQRIQEQIATLGQKTGTLPTDAKARLRQVGELLVPTLPQAWGNPDATVGHTRTDGTLCGYRSGFLVDAKRLIVTAVVFTGLTQREAPSVLTALDTHYAIFQRYPQRLGLDSAYEYDDIHVAMANKEIEHVATVRSRPGAKGVFHSDAFIWHDDGQLRCPADHIMAHIGGPYKNHKERYQATFDCATCPLFNNCFTPKQQAKQGDKPRRVLQIETASHQRAQFHRVRSRSPEGRALRYRRFAAERLFGHNNRYHNGDKAPYRSGPMDNIAQLMVAFVSNLETLATYA
ncbi:MAG: transposase, partial [Proteobacteria bacterium]|nr:transposase [Pseudomonadota bacterium]